MTHAAADPIRGRRTQPTPAATSRLRRSHPRPLVLGIVLGLLVVGDRAWRRIWSCYAQRATAADRSSLPGRRRARGIEHGPADYDLDLELTGNRPGKIHVEVRDGEVVHMTRDGVEPSRSGPGTIGRCPACSTRSARNWRWPATRPRRFTIPGDHADGDVGRVRSRVGLSR